MVGTAVPHYAGSLSVFATSNRQTEMDEAVRAYELGRGVKCIARAKLAGATAKTKQITVGTDGKIFDTPSTARNRHDDWPRVPRGRTACVVIRSSVNSRYQPRSLLFIGAVFGEGPDQDSLLILHPSQLEARHAPRGAATSDRTETVWPGRLPQSPRHVERVSHDRYTPEVTSRGPRP